MDPFPPPLQWMRLSGLTVLGRSPVLFHTIANFGSGTATLVARDTGLCIEAPPRSSNSFFVVGFGMANPGVRLAHHHHVPAQVHRAIRYGIPTVALLRNPLDSALAKAAPGNEPFLIGTTLRRWLSFWRGVDGIMNSIVVARFEDVIADPGRVVSRINAKYSAEFSSDFPATSDVFAALEAHRISDQGISVAEKPNPNIPSEEIKLREDDLRPIAQGHRLAGPALRSYESILERIGAHNCL